jgi:hypothetical protein
VKLKFPLTLKLRRENTIEAFKIFKILQVREELKSKIIDAKIFGKKSLRT